MADPCVNDFVPFPSDLITPDYVGTGFQGSKVCFAPCAGDVDGPMGPQGYRGFQGYRGPQGYRGAQGYRGFQGYRGAQGYVGPQGTIGPNKSAIVGYRPPRGDIKYVELICVEMPQPRFDDVLKVHLNTEQLVTRVKMDPVFVAVCEPHTIEVVGFSITRPMYVGLRVEGDDVVIELEKKPEHPMLLVIRLSGIRPGQQHRRFAERSQDEMKKNNRFWTQWEREEAQ